MFLPSMSTGHAGLDNALAGLNYGPLDPTPDGLPALLVVLPPPNASLSTGCTSVSQINVMRCFRNALSSWSLDAHQWDARGTELQPVLDVWQPTLAASARASVATRWAQNDATRIVVAVPPTEVTEWGQSNDAATFVYLVSAAPLRLAEAGNHVLVVLLDEAVHCPAPLGGRVMGDNIFAPAALSSRPQGLVTVVGALRSGSWSVLPTPQSMPIPIPSPPTELRCLPRTTRVSKRKRLGEATEEGATDDMPSRSLAHKKLSSCSYQVPTFPSSRPSSPSSPHTCSQVLAPPQPW